MIIIWNLQGGAFIRLVCGDPMRFQWTMNLELIASTIANVILQEFLKSNTSVIWPQHRTPRDVLGQDIHWQVWHLHDTTLQLRLHFGILLAQIKRLHKQNTPKCKTFVWTTSLLTLPLLVFAHILPVFSRFYLYFIAPKPYLNDWLYQLGHG